MLRQSHALHPNPQKSCSPSIKAGGTRPALYTGGITRREAHVAAVLIVDDEIGIRSFLSEALADGGHEVVAAAHAAEALECMRDRPFDVVLLDLKMPGGLGGMDVLRHARAEHPDLPVIILTAHATIASAVDAMKSGAFDVLEKPIESPDALRRMVSRALKWRAKSEARSTGTEPKNTMLVEEPSKRGRVRHSIKRLLWQMKRRHVYNVVATYAAVVFVSLQVAELLLPALPLPEWSYQLLVALAVVGLPVAMMLGWIYDITENGVKRTSAARDLEVW
jgi:CheY-like chemotaxis protein